MGWRQLPLSLLARRRANDSMGDCRMLNTEKSSDANKRDSVRGQICVRMQEI